MHLLEMLCLEVVFWRRTPIAIGMGGAYKCILSLASSRRVPSWHSSGPHIYTLTHLYPLAELFCPDTLIFMAKSVSKFHASG